MSATIKPADESEAEDKLAIPTQKSGRGIFVLGVISTATWIAIVVAWWWNRLAEIHRLGPNEFGDFLAGIFAPVAFLWLVLGFWQQGHELRNSANALWLQMKELRNSVGQQEQLVLATRDLRQAERDIHRERLDEEARASQPMITIGQSGGMTLVGTEQYEFRHRVFNAGRPCTEVQVLVDGKLVRRMGILHSGQQEDFAIQATLEETIQHRCDVSWIDERNNPGRKSFLITTGRDGRQIEVITDQKGRGR